MQILIELYMNPSRVPKPSHHLSSYKMQSFRMKNVRVRHIPLDGDPSLSQYLHVGNINWTVEGLLKEAT